MESQTASSHQVIYCLLCFLLLVSHSRDRLNPLRVGLWSGSHLRREWLSLQGSHQ
uniref:Uncharacterized protein n=1 Tax=Arundo donax TaxID=35708 RepID=A0A0A9HBB2_ARUDO